MENLRTKWSHSASTRIACGLARHAPLSHAASDLVERHRPLSAVQDGQCWRWGAAIRTELAWKVGTQINLGAAASGSHSSWCDAAGGSAGTVDARQDQPHADANKPA